MKVLDIVFYLDEPFYGAPCPAIVRKINPDGTVDLTSLRAGQLPAEHFKVPESHEGGPGWSRT